MKEQLISFETAKLAKEKGFEFDVTAFEDDEEDMALYGGYSQYAILPNSEEHTLLPLYWIEFNHGGHECTDNIDCPTQSLLQRWLREEHKIFIEVNLHNTLEFWVDITHLKDGDRNDLYVEDEAHQTKYFKIYEDALEAGLIATLKLI